MPRSPARPRMPRRSPLLRLDQEQIPTRAGSTFLPSRDASLGVSSGAPPRRTALLRTARMAPRARDDRPTDGPRDVRPARRRPSRCSLHIGPLYDRPHCPSGAPPGRATPHGGSFPAATIGSQPLWRQPSAVTRLSCLRPGDERYRTESARERMITQNRPRSSISPQAYRMCSSGCPGPGLRRGDHRVSPSPGIGLVSPQHRAPMGAVNGVGPLAGSPTTTRPTPLGFAYPCFT